MRIPTSQADCKMRGHAIIGAENYTSGGEIIPIRYAGVIDFGKLTNPRHEDAPAILGCGLYHRRAALAFWPRRSSKAHIEFTNAGVDRKTRRAEAAAASPNIRHTPL